MSRASEYNIRHIVENAEAIFHSRRWYNGVVWCPYCQCFEVYEYANYHYRCKRCGNRFTDRTRTVLHNSKLPTKTWLLAAYEMVMDNYISSNVLAKKIGVTQKTALLIQNKIRFKIQLEKYQLTGIIAMDEAYIGGCISNYHYAKKQALMRQMGLMGINDKRHTKSALYALNKRMKSPVYGMTDGNNVVLYATPNPIRSTYLHYIYGKHVVGDSVCVSDESKLYNNWEKITGSKIYTNNHSRNQYTTEEGLSSNRIENVFSRLKSGYKSRITHSKYTQLYLNEFCFRFNNRDKSPQERLNELVDVMCVCGGNITYKKLKQYNSLSIFKVKEKHLRHIYTLTDIKEMFKGNSIAAEIHIGKTIYRKEDFKD